VDTTGGRFLLAAETAHVMGVDLPSSQRVTSLAVRLRTQKLSFESACLLRGFPGPVARGSPGCQPSRKRDGVQPIRRSTPSILPGSVAKIQTNSPREAFHAPARVGAGGAGVHIKA